MSDSELTAEVINLVSKHAMCQPETLSVGTRIGEDLRIVGDDADELLTEFADKFNIDMSEMDFSRYFPSEASPDMHFYLASIASNKSNGAVIHAIRFIESKFWKIFSSNVDYQTMTIKDLVNSAKRGKW